MYSDKKKTFCTFKWSLTCSSKIVKSTEKGQKTKPSYELKHKNINQKYNLHFET